MEQSTVEYIIKRKVEGKLLATKILLAVSYVVIFVILALVIVNLAAPLLHIPFILLALALTVMTAFITWRFTCIEYEVVIASGEISFTVIYGKSLRKKLCDVAINSFGEIGVYDDEAYARLSRTSLQKNYLCVSSLSAPDLAYATFSEGQDTAVIYFDADDRVLATLRRQNPSAYRRSGSK